MLSLNKDIDNILIQEVQEPEVLTALRFYGAGSYQNCIANNVNMARSQSSVSKWITNVSNILNLPEGFNDWVHFPSRLNELQEIRNKFWGRRRFPVAIGCIDCTYVAIYPPLIQDNVHPEHIYVNRKQYHSINVQLICDPDLRIMNVNARYIGSTHESYIWNNNKILPIIQEIHNRGHSFFL